MDQSVIARNALVEIGTDEVDAVPIRIGVDISFVGTDDAFKRFKMDEPIVIEGGWLADATLIRAVEVPIEQAVTLHLLRFGDLHPVVLPLQGALFEGHALDPLPESTSPYYRESNTFRLDLLKFFGIEPGELKAEVSCSLGTSSSRVLKCEMQKELED